MKYTQFKLAGAGIFSALVQNGPEVHHELCNIFRKSVAIDHVLQPWRIITIVYILKHDRVSHLNAQDYIPISLNSLDSKTRDNHNIRKGVLEGNPLPLNQHTYWPRTHIESTLHGWWVKSRILWAEKK